ncbi:MAG: kynureninase [Gemmatimonadetes bacterium]|nr:kynureninase [Gemmatimonadota bacterium]
MVVPPLSPEGLVPHYDAFRVSERVLLTGHSHQAWPDVARAGMERAWRDAASWVDEKWDRAFEVADRVRDSWMSLLDDADGDVALGQNTLELVARFLSALPLSLRPRLVTTDGEFHTVRRLLSRLEEEGVEIIRVPSGDADLVADAITEAVDNRTAAVLVSSVLFKTGRIVHGLDRVAQVCDRVGTRLLVDTYHHLNAVPFSLGHLGLDRAFVVGGGYKYCQLGEGNCFLRVPPGCTLRPVLTGWFAEFGALADRDRPDRVGYAEGHGRFAGATYDPVSHYRAEAVADFFREQTMTPERLRALSQHQVGRLASAIDALDLDPAVLTRDRHVPLEEIGGFLALHTPRAAELSKGLRRRGVSTDVRGETLRLGPAPYVTTGQLDEAVGHLEELVRGLD